MTALQAAGLWIGLNALLLAYLSIRVGQTRIRNKINLGDGDHPEMIRAVRAHGNYIEYAPAALLGLFAMASLGAGAVVVHAFGAAFFFARVAHLLGLGMGLWPQGRTVGAALTILGILAMGAYLIYLSLA